MQAAYFDPVFYICSEEMPFTIRIEAQLKDTVSEASLQYAFHKAIQRYPYFAVRIAAVDGELLAVPNELPLVVYHGTQVLPLGSAELNYHLLAASYHDDVIDFYMSHAMTDGGGFYPFIKTVLYYYICHCYQIALDPHGISLADDPMFEDELGNPYPEDRMEAAHPFCLDHKRDFFRLRDGGYVTDSQQTAYRLRVREAELMQFSLDHDGSPCALVSSLMAKAIWDIHPGEGKDLVSAVSFNLRPGLGNVHSYRLLCNALMLHYPNRLRSAEIGKLCTCTRGMIYLQSQPENVLYYAKTLRERISVLNDLPGISAKKQFLGAQALKDSVNNTFSVSYVGKPGLGSLEPYLDSIYHYTDGSTYQSVFIEISAVNGWFDIAFLQGFSSDVYYRALLKQLEQNSLHYVEDGMMPFRTPGIVLPA